jgi:hypothetical protein
LGEGINMSDWRKFAISSFDLEIELSMRGKVISFLLREYVSKVMIFQRQTGSVRLTS